MNYKIKYDDELMHFGILGMHWGKKNGPPYPLSPSDHSAEENRKSKDAEYYWKPGKDGKASRGEKIARTAGEIGTTAVNAAKKVHESNKEQPAEIDLSSKSDEELRKYINRKQLERQYKQLSSDDISVGKDKVEYALDLAGDVVSTAVSVATLVAIFKGAKFS